MKWRIRWTSLDGTYGVIQSGFYYSLTQAVEVATQYCRAYETWMVWKA